MLRSFTSPRLLCQLRRKANPLARRCRDPAASAIGRCRAWAHPAGERLPFPRGAARSPSGPVCAPQGVAARPGWGQLPGSLQLLLLPWPGPAAPLLSPTWCGARLGSAGPEGRQGAARAPPAPPSLPQGTESLARHGTGDPASCITESPSLAAGSSPPPPVSQGPTGCWQPAGTPPPRLPSPRSPPSQPGPGRRLPGASTCGAGPWPCPAPPAPPRLRAPPAAPGQSERAPGQRGPAPRRLPRAGGAPEPAAESPGPSRSSSPRGAKATVKAAPQACRGAASKTASIPCLISKLLSQSSCKSARTPRRSLITLPSAIFLGFLL